MRKEGILEIQVGDLVTRDGSELQRVIKLPQDWDRRDQMILVTVECVRASPNGWCEVGDVDCMLLDDLCYPDDLPIEEEQRSKLRQLPQM